MQDALLKKDKEDWEDIRKIKESCEMVWLVVGDPMK